MGNLVGVSMFQKAQIFVMQTLSQIYLPTGAGVDVLSGCT